MGEVRVAAQPTWVRPLQAGTQVVPKAGIVGSIASCCRDLETGATRLLGTSRMMGVAGAGVRYLAVLALVAGCSHPAKCFSVPDHVDVTHCPPGPVLELAQLDGSLVGKTVMVVGPLHTGVSWCQDCCNDIGPELELRDDTRARVGLGPLWCKHDARGAQTCPLPPDGRRIVVRGTLGSAGDTGAWYLTHVKLCQ